MMKVLKALAWVFTAATLVLGIMGLSGNETAIPYIPGAAALMVALIGLYLVLVSRRKQQRINQ